MKGDAEQVKKAAAEVGKVAAEKKEKMEEMLTRNSKKGAPPKDVLGLTDSMVEGIYAQAYRLYNTGMYDQAIKLFRMLTSINPNEPKYIMGLAACLHMNKEYNAAAGAYSVLAVVDPKSPLPYYHSSDCYVKLNDIPSAVIALNMAIERAGDKPEFKALKDRAKMTCEALKKEVLSMIKQE